MSVWFVDVSARVCVNVCVCVCVRPYPCSCSYSGGPCAPCLSKLPSTSSEMLRMRSIILSALTFSSFFSVLLHNTNTEVWIIQRKQIFFKKNSINLKCSITLFFHLFRLCTASLQWLSSHLPIFFLRFRFRQKPLDIVQIFLVYSMSIGIVPESEPESE